MIIISSQVEFEDLDPGKVVYHTNYLKFCERGRNAYFKSKHIDIMEMFSRNLAFAVFNIQATYLRPLELGEIRITTILSKIGKSSLLFHQEIFQDQKHAGALFKGDIKVVLVDVTEKKSISLPQEILSLL